MNSFELITKYLPASVDKYFYEDAKTAILEAGNKFVDVNFKESGYVKIASFLMDGMADYYSAQSGVNGGSEYASYAGNEGSGYRDGFAIGGTSVTWEIFKLQYKRGRQFKIDYIQDEETAGIVIGNAIEEFNRTKVVPEVDATRFSLIVDNASASLGNLIIEDVADNSIIGKFNTAYEWLTEHEVPEEEQVIFVSPEIMTKIRNTTELEKRLSQADFKSSAGITFKLDAYDGRPIIVVPSNRFFTNVLTTNNGYRAQTSSKLINFMIVAKKAVTPIRKLEWNKIYGPEQSGIVGYYGYIIDFLLYHGVVVPQNKVVGVYASVKSTGDATAKVNTLSIDTRAGASTQHSWLFKNYFTNPAGLRGQVVFAYYDSTAQSGTYAKDGFTLGATITGTEGTDYTNITLGETKTASGASAKAWFAVVDASGKIIAVSGKVDLTQHA